MALRRLTLALAVTLVLGALGGVARASSLRVSPVGLELAGGQAAATITLRNDDTAPANVQIRVFRWTQATGEDRLEPAEDLVVSPPIAALEASSERVVRIVRISAAPQAEESYRLIIDELPPPPGEASRRVRLLTRHSIPVFLGSGGHAAPRVAWRARVEGDTVTLVGRNTGGRRLRISNARLAGADGAPLAVHPGLLGYVLARSEMMWRLPVMKPGDPRPARLLADTDNGPIDVQLSPST